MELFNQRKSAFSCSLFFAIVLSVTGCGGPEVGRVEGQVTLDGQPLTGAVIVFEDATRGISVNAELNADGSYNARTFDKPGLPPGSYSVAIRPGSFASGETPLAGEGATGAGGNANTSPVPGRYHSPKPSGLTATVVVGDNPPIDFALTSADSD